MAKKKTGKTKKKKPSPKPWNLKTELKKVIIGFIILLLLVIAAGFLTYYLILKHPPVRSIEPIESIRPPQPKPPIKPVKKTEPSKRSVSRPSEPPVFEIFPEEKEILPKPIPETVLPEVLPRVAIIIDDMGYYEKLAEKFLELDAVFTFSILPHSPFQKTIAEAARAKGFDVMLHLPMEPVEYPEIDPGPGTLLTSMSPDQLIEQLIRDIDAVPFVVGVNNHMGSKMTTNSTQMYQIFSILKKKNLFFIDSLTTSGSLGKPSARLLQIPFAQRNVFIDHKQEPDFIRKQLKLLIRIAGNRGQAIGIAHPHRITYEIFREVLPELKQKVLLVSASDLVQTIGQ